MLSLESLGAAEEVTGSCHLVRMGEYKILLDCGMFQGRHKDELRNRDDFPFSPSEIDAVILSHAHIDHSGRIPLLINKGYKGPVYTHEATRDLCRIMLRDAAYLNQKDVEWENRKRERKGLKPIEPLYTMDDADKAVQQTVPLKYNEIREILPGVKVRLSDAGHILGSAIVELWLDDGGEEKKIVFSGDLGHADAPIMRNPALVQSADLVVLESTYGDRLHRSWSETRDEILAVLAETTTAKGNILIPAFAVGRSQMILYWLAEYFEAANLSQWHIFLDSPMAIEATAAYTAYTQLYDDRARELWREHQRNSLLPNLHMTVSTQESMAINNIRAGAIIIAGSGMCSGGRIRHHLLNNVWREECHVIIVGYQADGTTGRALVEGAKRIRLRGETVKVAATVHTIGGLSAHADQNGLLNWYGHFNNRPPVLLVHGEPLAQQALASNLSTELRAPVRIVKRNEKIDIGQPLAQ
ncbi:MAG: MBL fold metallo-hydrolase RNA specificity domain-containing protein [Gammaproteobacteria bacterium]